jgi:hypothetical protein
VAEATAELPRSGTNRYTPEMGLKGLGSRVNHLWGPRPSCEKPLSGHRGLGSGRQSSRTYLGIVLGSGEEGQLIGGGEVGPNMLHLPKALPLPPLGYVVLLYRVLKMYLRCSCV